MAEIKYVTPSVENQARVKEFEDADAAYSKTWADFEEKAKQWFDMLEDMREKRNRRLDDAIRALREEATRTKQSIKSGPFKVDAKTKRYFAPEEFVKLAKDYNVLDALKTAGAVVEKTEVDTERAAEWLKTSDLVGKFIPSYHEDPMTPAVTGPKEVPPFGSPVKTGSKK